MNLYTSIQSPASEQNKDHIPGENEYIGDDGLIHCAICHEAKEKRLPENYLFRALGTYSVPCACARRKHDAEEQQRRKEEHQRNVSRLRSICFPAKIMHTWTFENSQYDSVPLEISKKYVEKWEEMQQKNTGLLFWGNVGSGKSYLAACIANALIEQEISVRMTTLASVLNHEWESRYEYIRDLCSASLLILDDFGMERDTSFGLETVYDVINTRVLNHKPMILTTNLTYSEMRNPMDIAHERIYSRVLGATTAVQFLGPDLRDNSRKQHLQFMKKMMKGDESL